MKFLADMGIAQTTVHWLRKNGYDAIHLREENLHRATDSEILKKAKGEDRVLLFSAHSAHSAVSYFCSSSLNQYM